MKKLPVVCASILMVAMVTPVFAQDDELVFECSRFRNRFDHVIGTFDNESDDVEEYFEDDIDITFSVSKGDVSAEVEVEHSDATFSGDVGEQEGVSDYLGYYEFAWTPEALADKEFTLTVGSLGNCWGSAALGACAYGDASDRGAINLSMNLGPAATTFEYVRIYEGNTVDDTEGDEHWVRSWFSMPVAEKYAIGGYVGLITASDLIFEEGTPGAEGEPGTPPVKGDRNGFLLGTEFSGSAGKVDFYTEAGFASGTEDQGTVEMDMSGFYVLSGANFAVGKVSLGLEAGMGSGDDDPADDEDNAWIGPSSDWYGIPGLLNDWGDWINGAGSISNLTYLLLTADMDPSDKMSLSSSLAYMMPTEEVGGIDSYGLDFGLGMAYSLSNSLTYSLDMYFAVPNEDWIEDNKYLVRNRLEFSL